MIVQIPELKFKANIARNATFEDLLGQNFGPILVKKGKKTDYFQKYRFS